jgi:antitoxin MazE
LPEKKTRLVRIGNSRGLRLPKPLIEEAGLKDEVEVTLRDGALVITGAEHPRAGWEGAVDLLLERREDSVIDEPTPTRFDDEEWEW